mgnify:CR=1 FL=1
MNENDLLELASKFALQAQNELRNARSATKRDDHHFYMGRYDAFNQVACLIAKVEANA